MQRNTGHFIQEKWAQAIKSRQIIDILTVDSSSLHLTMIMLVLATSPQQCNRASGAGIQWEDLFIHRESPWKHSKIVCRSIGGIPVTECLKEGHVAMLVKWQKKSLRIWHIDFLSSFKISNFTVQRGNKMSRRNRKLLHYFLKLSVPQQPPW